MTVLGSPDEWTHTGLESDCGDASDDGKAQMTARAQDSDRSRPISSMTTGTAVTIIRPNNFTMRFSGAPGHAVHPRHFLKEFRIAMRDLGITSNQERLEAFEDYLVVDSAAEQWYNSVRSMYTGTKSWDDFQTAFLEHFPGESFTEPTSPTTARKINAIKSVKFRQDAAVSAYIKATWKAVPPSSVGSPTTSQTEIDSNEDVQSVKLGRYKAIATEETFELSKYGIPDGAQVRFTSHVWGVGDYSSEEDLWFTHDITATKGADFRQSGTAFKGWLNHTGRFDL